MRVECRFAEAVKIHFLSNPIWRMSPKLCLVWNFYFISQLAQRTPSEVHRTVDSGLHLKHIFRHFTDLSPNVHVHVRYMSSPVRLSVCRLSSATYVHPIQVIEFFGNVSMPFGTLALCDLSVKILRKSSQGNPSVGGVRHKRGSQI